MNSSEVVSLRISRGFTLIELLVVVAIIGLLSSVVLSSLNAARMRARDAERRSDIVQIRNALELYFLAYGYYPSEQCVDSSKGSNNDCSAPTGAGWTSSASIYTALVPTYIKQLPVDPLNDASHYYNYEPNGGGQGTCTTNVCEYSLNVRLESGAYYCVGTAKNLPGC
ncbi:MAG: prepilin-type N-terminal cleavage/methylation domain-containing protein [Candidatus Pacebacteria bacterium]|nr:prepilin-type N-terminal cleavage/methylation domain-containing protein [Candidatus Paceibacterota bacterium]